MADNDRERVLGVVERNVRDHWGELIEKELHHKLTELSSDPNTHFNYKGFCRHVVDTEAILIYPAVSSSVAGHVEPDDVREALSKIVLGYVDGNLTEYGLVREPGDKSVVSEGLVERIKEAGKLLIVGKGIVTNREITERLGMKPTNSNVSFVRANTQSNHLEWNWGMTMDGEVTYHYD